MSNDDRQVIFSLIGVGKVHPPKRQVLKDIYLSFFYGAKIGVLGLNGSGKSTLLRIIAGVEREYLGEITFSKGYSVGLLEQEPQMDSEKTVKEVVEEGCARMMGLLAEYEAVSGRFGEDLSADEMDALLEQQAKLQDEIEAGNGWELESQLEVAMDALRCPPPETKVDVLSGGERRRVALCRLLIQEPDILLLDEPTNHLDAESVQWLEQHLKRYQGTVIAVTHDRYFLDNVAGWILELDRGHGIPFEGTTPRGWNRSRRAWTRRRKPYPGGARPWSGSWSGSASLPGHGRPRARPGSHDTSSCWARSRRAFRRIWRSTSRRDRAWAMWCSRPKA